MGVCGGGLLEKVTFEQGLGGREGGMRVTGRKPYRERD